MGRISKISVQWFPLGRKAGTEVAGQEDLKEASALLICTYFVPGEGDSVGNKPHSDSHGANTLVKEDRRQINTLCQVAKSTIKSL